MIAPPRRKRRRPRLEALEPRVNPALFLVTNTSSDAVTPGSLAFAIEAANEIPGPDTIEFDGGVFGPAGIRAVVLDLELPTITDSVDIVTPPGIRLSIERASAAPDFGIFRIQQVEGPVTVNLVGLRIANGSMRGLTNNGGNLTLRDGLVEDNVDAPDGLGGGGIYSTGDLTLINTTVRNNRTDAGLGGGGVFSDSGSFRATNSTFSGNSAGFGSGLYVLGNSGPVRLVNTTFSNNVSQSPNGGAVYVESFGVPQLVDFDSATVADNQSGGVVLRPTSNADVTARYRNSLFADNGGANLSALAGAGSAFFVSLGNNLSTDSTGNLTQPSDLPNRFARLRPLGDYGGPVPTRALRPDSPAIRAGASGVATDARGFSRGQALDIGAFEATYAFSLLGGDGQSTRAGQAFPDLLVAQFTESGMPAAGLPVLFANGSGFLFDGSGSAVVFTDANGLAVSPDVTAGTTSGRGFATVSDLAVESATFILTVTPGFTVGYAFAPPPASVLPGDEFFLDVQPIDQFGNPDALSPAGLVFSSTDPAAILPSFEFDYGNRPAGSPPNAFRVGGLSLSTFGDQTITARPDFGEGDFGDPITLPAIRVLNTNPPTLDLRDDDDFANQGEPYRRAGRVVDTADKPPVSLVANYGDGGVVDVPVAADGSFLLQYTYAGEGSFVVVVTVSSEGATTDEVSFFVDVLLPGVPTDSATKAKVVANSTGLIVAPGVSVVYKNNGDRPAFLIVAPVPERVADRLDTTFFTSQDKEILNSFDVRVIDASRGDEATVRFQFTPDPRQVAAPILTYFNRSTGNQEPVVTDEFRYDEAARTFTFVLDADSLPSLLSLSGTVFTISAQVNLTIAPGPIGEGGGGTNPTPGPVPPITPTPPVVVPTSPVAAGFSVTTGLVQAALILGGQSSLLLVSERAKSELAVALSDGAEGGERVGRAAAAQGGQAALVSVLFFGAGSASEAAALLSAAESGPLRELPLVPPVLTDLPSATVTPAAADSISATPPAAPPAGAPGGPEEEFEEDDAPLLDVDAFLLSALAPALFFHSRRRQRRRDDLLVVAGIDRLVRERRV